MIEVTITQKYDHIIFSVQDFQGVSDILKPLGDVVKDVKVEIVVKTDEEKRKEQEDDVETD